MWHNSSIPISRRKIIIPPTEDLNDEDADVRGEAIVALGKIGDARALEPLILALKNKNEDVQGTAEAAL